MRALLTLAGLGDTAEEVMQVWSSYREQIGQTGLSQQMAEQQMNTLKGATMRLRAAFQEVSITIGQAMAPALEKLLPPLGELIVNIAELLAPALRLIANIIAAIVTPALNALNTALDRLQEAVEWFSQNVVGFFQDLYEKLVGSSIWLETWDRIVAAAEEGVRSVHETIEAGLGRFEAAFRPNVQVAPRLIAPTFTVNVQVHGVVREEADIARLARAIEDRVAYRLWLRAREVSMLWT